MLWGDFKAKIGKGRVEGIVEAYGLGNRNERGNLLVQFSHKEELMIAKRSVTCQKTVHLEGAFDSKNNIIRNQIYYVLMNKR